MTTFNPSPNNLGLPDEFAPIAQRLEAVGSRFRLAAIARASAWFLAMVIPTIVGVLFLTGFFTLPAIITIALGFFALAIVALAYILFLHRPLWHAPTLAQIARWIEEHAPDAKLPLSNELINAVLLAQEYEAGTQALADRTASRRGSPWIPHVLREIDRATASQNLAASVPWKRQLLAWIIAGVMLLGSAVVVVAAPANIWGRGFYLLGHPAAYAPKTGINVKFLSVEPGNDTVLVGQPISFAANVQDREAKVRSAVVELKFASGKTQTLKLNPLGTENNRYGCLLEKAAESFDYTMTIGDSQSPERYHIDVLPDIHVTTYQLSVTPPAYTGRGAQNIRIAGKDLNAAKGSLEVPMGSTVEISAALDIPAHEVLLDVAGKNPVEMTRGSEGKIFSARMTVIDPIRFGIQVNDSAARTLRRYPDEGSGAVAGNSLSYFALAPIPDPAPTVTITDPARDLDAKPGDKVRLAATANDEFYGLTALRLEIAKGKESPDGKDDFVTVKDAQWSIAPGPDGKPLKSFAAQYELNLPARDYRLGDVLRYRFTAVDNRDLLKFNSDWGPQATHSQVFTISFNDTAAAARKTSDGWEQLRKKLTAILDAQVKLRADANGLTLVPLRMGVTTQPAAKDLATVKDLAKKIGTGQTGIRADLVALGKDFPFEASMKLVQRSVQVLAAEDANEAVDRAADIGLLSDGKALPPTATKLRQHQSRIIDVLQALLAISTTEQKRLDPLASKEGSDLPQDAKKAWEKLKDDLEKFKKDQKEVINSTADLAKKPKDEFTKADEQKLKDLAAIEDKWEKFLAQRLVDMSKIAEQDQANVSILEEMVKMKVELAMAKDALQTKATEIATPLEENALENANKLTDHLERWLQQSPDRQKWQMEDPVNQTDTKMAELPKQLQDMVGDLMDKEEDLTDEMESSASKWNDSLNKGAGWDAGDGPISNQSAQGVTGNQLPKNMEIQGRSGEGREGRASGEMVGAEAEGKGGRRTPTRMTPEPFSNSKVDDKSKDPAGGATGGGKKGQFGGEGLEGAGPQEDQTKVMQRLQGKQAALRNETERLQLQMRAQGFNNFKLLEAAALMQKADDAMKSYNYQNALYFQQQAIQSLNSAKVLAAGQVHVTTDTAPQTSEKTQKDIQDALNGVMPKGYADPVKAYFEKLAKPE